jgi:hypothetical protein
VFYAGKAFIAYSKVQGKSQELTPKVKAPVILSRIRLGHEGLLEKKQPCLSGVYIMAKIALS